jgi:hypothetical protein
VARPRVNRGSPGLSPASCALVEPAPGEGSRGRRRMAGVEARRETRLRAHSSRGEREPSRSRPEGGD